MGLATRRAAVLLALSAVAATAVLAPNAQAGSVKASGHVIAPPSPYKGKLGVPVLLSQGSQKSLRTGSPVARLLVGKLEKVPVSGKARIAAADLAPGDAVTAKVQRAKKGSGVISLPARGLTVTKRGGNTMSNADLQAALYELARQYFGTTAHVDELTRSLEARIAKLEAGQSSAIQGLQNDVAGLTSQLGNLQSTVTTLTNDLGTLSTLVDQICAVPAVDLVVACP